MALLMVLFGLSVGYLSAPERPRHHRLLPSIAVALIVGSGALMLVRESPEDGWAPLALFVGTISGMAAGDGATLVGNPLTADMGFWRRLAFAWRHGRLLREHSLLRARSRSANGTAAGDTGPTSTELRADGLTDFIGHDQ